MADIEKILKDIAVGGIGAVATIAEKGSELAKTLVEKGQNALEENKGTVDNMKKAFNNACESVKNGLQELGKIDYDALSQEARDAIRKALDEADAKVKAAKEAAEKSINDDPVAEAAREEMEAAAAGIEQAEEKVPVIEVKDEE
ncbi:MAG: hypothetical protein Q4C54_04980 [Clostridia bacterium]|nr:hypothetical protein [Clostridia bacterium]